MVKLAFKPTDKGIESVVSKKRDRNLSPFSAHQKLIPDFVPQTHKLNVNDLVGLENCAYVLNEWFLKNNNKILLLIGPTGCGKTTLVESYCRENSIELYSVKSGEKTKKELLRDIFLFSEYSSTSFFIKRQSLQKKLLLIDEYQNGQTDLLTISDITNLNLLRNHESRIENKKELKLFLNDLVCPFTVPPIIVISSDSKGSKLSDLKKLHETYYINEIPFGSLKTWIQSFKFPLTDQQLNEIIRKCKSDKRLLLNTLGFLKEHTNSSVNEFIDSFYKDTDLSIFNFLEFLFSNEEIQFNEIFKMYETDGFMISNLVHENYLEYNDNIHDIAKSAEAISLGETLFSDTFESTRTFIPESHCLNSLIIPSYYSRSDKPNKNIRTSCINNRYNIYLNNQKIINKINLNKVNSIDIMDILYIKKFLNSELVKQKVLKKSQEEFIKNIIGSLGNNIDKLELIYKHFSEFNQKELKTKNFTLKFKEKIKKLNLI